MTHPLLADYPVVIELPVCWGEMDSYRHVNNVVYFRYLENARLEYFREMAWEQYEQDTGIGPILATTQCRFRRPLTYPDRVWVGARVTSLGSDRFAMDHRVISAQLDDIAALGQSTIVIYHYARGTKVAMPEELRQRIEKLEGRRIPAMPTEH